MMLQGHIKSRLPNRLLFSSVRYFIHFLYPAFFELFRSNFLLQGVLVENVYLIFVQSKVGVASYLV